MGGAVAALVVDTLFRSFFSAFLRGSARAEEMLWVWVMSSITSEKRYSRSNLSLVSRLPIVVLASFGLVSVSRLVSSGLVF